MMQPPPGARDDLLHPVDATGRREGDDLTGEVTPGSIDNGGGDSNEQVGRFVDHFRSPFGEAVECWTGQERARCEGSVKQSSNVTPCRTLLHLELVATDDDSTTPTTTDRPPTEASPTPTTAGSYGRPIGEILWSLLPGLIHDEDALARCRRSLLRLR